MPTEALDARLTELETRFAFFDDTLQSISDTVATHDRQMQEFRNLVDRLRAELVAVRGTLAHDVAEEPPPPHY